MPSIAHDQEQFYKSKIRSLIAIDHGISRRELQERLDKDGLHLDRHYRGSETIYAQHVERDGRPSFQEVCERNLEGIVCKRRMSVYAEHGWLKIKNPKYTQMEGRHEMFTRFHQVRAQRSPSKG